MARYEDLTEKELRAKAKEQKIEGANTMTRDQLVAELSKNDPEAQDPDAMGKKAGKGSDFVTPVVNQGEVTMGADEGEREISGTGGEQAPVEGEEADQSSAGGTGGEDVSGLGAPGSTANVGVTNADTSVS